MKAYTVQQAIRLGSKLLDLTEKHPVLVAYLVTVISCSTVAVAYAK